MNPTNRPTIQDMDSWMRSIERRVMAVERRGNITNAAQIMGPGLAPYAVQIKDWSGSETTFNGMFYTAPGAFNSPDPDAWWIGLVLSQPGGFGVQVVWDYRGATLPPPTKTRRWSSVGNTRVFTSWA